VQIEADRLRPGSGLLSAFAESIVLSLIRFSLTGLRSSQSSLRFGEVASGIFSDQAMREWWEDGDLAEAIPFFMY